jgi:hypothetical protein
MTRWISRSSSVAVLFFSLAGCKNQTPPAAEASVPEPPPPAAEAAGNKFSDESYDLVMQPKGAYASGQPGEAEVVLTAKPPFHMSQDYPYKLKLNESPGLKFPKPVVEKDQVKLEAMSAVVPVGFTVEGAGKHTVSGKLFFGICKEDQCKPVNHELALDIDVK